MTVERNALLAREGNGAVQVDEAAEEPLLVFLAGPIKFWWGQYLDGTDIWGSDLHELYTEWRDRVRLAIVKTGFCATYSPHRALQGTWHESLQVVNDAAIEASDVMVDLTPPGVPADGTADEIKRARRYFVPVWSCPPAGDLSIAILQARLKQRYIYLRKGIV